MSKIIKILLLINDKLKCHQISQALRSKNVILSIYSSTYELLYFEEKIDYDLMICDPDSVQITQEMIKLFKTKGSNLYIPLCLILDENSNFFGSKISLQDLITNTDELILQFKNIIYSDNNKLINIRKQIAEIMKDNKISSKLVGYDYLQEAIIYILKNKKFSLSKDIYPFISAKYNTSVSNIEKNIRYAITKSTQNNMTNKEYIFDIIEKINYL